VRERLHAISGGTPADVRIIGVTAPGACREREMLEATKHAIIKGEWRLVTPELRALVAGWAAAGQWFVESGNRKARFKEAGVAERATPHLWAHHRAEYGYWQAHQVADRVGDADPSLLADWHGFTPSAEPPEFAWPSLKRAAA
jgi:hypothetical protein